MTPREILRTARALSAEACSCAYVAIADAASAANVAPEPLWQVFADVIGVDISEGRSPIWRWWDAATVAERAAVWERVEGRP